MLEIRSYSVGPLATNSYLLISSQTSSTLLFDPGDDGDFLSQEIISHSLALEGILLTHAHFDHLLGLLPLHLNFPSAPIYLHEADEFLYRQAVASAIHWVGQGYSPDPPPSLNPHTLLNSLSGKLKISSAFSPIVIPTPGHTPGSVCYHFPEDNLLFSGDTLFAGAVGRTDLSYSRPLDLATSLAKLKHLPGGTQVYPGHGQPTTVKQELDLL